MKKPRNKKYRPKDIVKPLNMRSAVMLELPGYVAIDALGQSHFVEQHVYDLISAADMARRIAPDGHAVLPVAQRMVEVLAEVQERMQRLGKLGVTGEQMQTLKAGFSPIMSFLRNASNHQILKAARDAVEEFDRNGVLRV